MCMRCYVFLSDESLLTWFPNVINCICIYTNSILTLSTITYSSLADIAPGFSMVERQLVLNRLYCSLVRTYVCVDSIVERRPAVNHSCHAYIHTYVHTYSIIFCWKEEFISLYQKIRGPIMMNLRIPFQTYIRTYYVH